MLTDGQSWDEVFEISEFGRSLGITLISVGIGRNVNEDELIEISGTAANYIRVASYKDIPHLSKFIANYFCMTNPNIIPGYKL